MKTATIITSLLLLCMQASAQRDSSKHYINHHRFELSFTGGAPVSAKISGDVYPERYYKWSVGLSPVYALGLSYYIIPRISVGVQGNFCRWNATSSGVVSISKKKPNNMITSALFANYDLPVRSSIFYGGVLAGIVNNNNVIGDNKGNLKTGSGKEFNVHVGYKLTLVKSRFWFNIEGAFSHIGIESGKGYSIVSYPVSLGLKFRP